MLLNALFRYWPALAVAIAFAAFAVSGSSVRVEALTNCDVADLSVDSEEQAFLTLINNYRAQNGKSALTMSSNLNRAASWMAKDLGTNNYFSHTDSSGRSAGTRAANCGSSGGIGENIAAGTYIDTAQEAIDLWKSSSGHNANMLNGTYRQIGIARYYVAGSTYGWYWVTDFSTVDDCTTVQPNNSCAAPSITSDYDTDNSGGGSVSFTWSPVPGATAYRISRRSGSSWSVVGTTSGTSYSGADLSNDADWRVYVATGTCAPTPGPATAFDPDGVPACTPPALKSKSDTNSSGAGTVSFSWNPVFGATAYRVARRENGAWVVKATVSGTSYSGADASDDPQWRIYVASGGCTPVPEPTTVFDP